MAYTPENINTIISRGKLEIYIEMAESLIASLADATVEFDKSGENTVSVAHLRGHYGVCAEGLASPEAYASCSRWSKQWDIANFGGDRDQAVAYAKGALVKHINEIRDAVLAGARRDLASLLAAKGV